MSTTETTPPDFTKEIERLTKRQREVLGLIGAGKMTKEIASELGCCVKTVEKHRQSLYQRLNIHSIGEAVKVAFKAGLVL